MWPAARHVDGSWHSMVEQHGGGVARSFPYWSLACDFHVKGAPLSRAVREGGILRMCATPLLTLSSSRNTRGQETQSSWAQNKRNSETLQRREPKPGLVNIHLIPPSRKSRESGAPESWWFHNETELKRLGHPSPTLWMTEGKKNQ